MNDGSITFSTELDNKELEQQLAHLKKKILSVEDKISQMQAERMPLVDQSRQLGAELDAANAKLHEMQGAAAGAFSSEQISDQTLRVNGLQAEWNRVQGRVERYDTDISNASLELDRNKEKAGEVASELASAGYSAEKMGKATERAHKSMGRFALRVREVVRSALIFTLITQALAKFREWIGKIIMVNSEAREATARLKAALLTLAQPIVNVIIPAFIKFVNVLSQVIMAIARFVSMIFGTTLEKSRKSAEALNDQTTALDGVGGAAEKATKSLASFDEINQLSGDSGSGVGGVGASSGVAADFSGLEEFDTQEYKDKIDELTVYVSGALLALGTILAFSGVNIPLGIGLMALGAAGLAMEIIENYGAMNEKVKSAIDKVLLALGAASLVIGAILAFSGANIPLGIGLMILGAASLGTAAALNWDLIRTELRGPLGKILAQISSQLLVIGGILAFSGADLPLGISLMAIGAIGLSSVLALNWDKVRSALQGPVGKITALIGGALLAVGAVLAFSGAALPLGITLMAIGAASLATVAALNWDALKKQVSDRISEILVIGGSSLLAIGLILALSGAAIPLGIGMMIAGGASLAAAAVLNWDYILDKLKGVWAGVKNWWNTDIAPVFTRSWWEDKFSCIHLALEQKIKDALNAGIGLFNRFADWLNEKLNIQWDSVEILGKEIIPKGAFQLFTMPHIPALATGAVIPPNREFMAVLGDQKSGTNIEAPLSTIEQAVQNVLSRNGGGETVINNIVELDGEVVFRNQKKVSRRHGQILVE